jgi:hypothetical protein
MLLEYGANSHLSKSEGGVFCITQSYLLTDCIKGKDGHIQVLNNQVQAIEAQFTLLQLHNIFLSEEADNKKKSDKQQENSSLYKRLDNYVGGR